MRSIKYVCAYIITACFFLYSEDVTWNGKTYDTETVADMITIITTTNPIPTIPNLTHIYPAQVSLFRIPALALCKKIIVFDGIQPGYQSRASDYDEYKRTIMNLTNTDPYFSNTQMVFCETWVHLAGAIKEAMQYVETPFVFIHQHDFVLLKEFDMNALVASMVANPNIKHVRFNRAPYNTCFGFDGPVDEVIEGIHFVPLCRTFGWSDNDHLSRTEYYRNIVLPMCYNPCAMEHVLNPDLRKNRENHEKHGTYLYGDITDGGYFEHSDGRSIPYSDEIRNSRRRHLNPGSLHLH